MTLTELYRAIRANHRRLSARDALAQAREALAAGRSIYITERYAYNPRNKDERGRLTERRWIENTRRAGLRDVGYADDIVRLNHQGWYTDEDGGNGEVLRGHVWQLPARDGCAVYVAGYKDPNNKGAAFIDFEPMYGERGGDKNGSRWSSDRENAIRDAARAADHIAERNAETEREYQAKWQAARRVEYARERITAARDAHSDLTAELRACIEDTHNGDYPAVCAAIRATLRRYRDEVRAAVREIHETIDTYGADILTDQYR